MKLNRIARAPIAVCVCFALASCWSETRIGGSWHVRTQETLLGEGTSASNAELWRGSHKVATIVHTYRYYGDDCLAYSSGASIGEGRSYFVCGKRQPMRLGAESLATWDFDVGALRQRGVENSSTAFDRGAQVISIADAKRLAGAQPLRFKE
jgi:hypothetical protein